MAGSSHPSCTNNLLFGCDRRYAVYSTLGETDATTAKKSKCKQCASWIKPHFALPRFVAGFCSRHLVFQLFLQLTGFNEAIVWANSCCYIRRINRVWKWKNSPLGCSYSCRSRGYCSCRNFLLRFLYSSRFRFVKVTRTAFVSRRVKTRLSVSSSV